jgi:hypothetical protein
MRRASLLLALAVALTLAASVPAEAAKASRTRTPVRLKSPSPANATVAGFKINLVRAGKSVSAGKADVSLALAHAAAALPKNVSVYAVVAKQKRSDRVQGVFVAVNRASAVTTPARTTRVRRLTVNLKHAAVPKGFKLTLKTVESDNVLVHHRVFLCRNYFHTSDLAGAQKLGGPGLPSITLGTVIQSACSAAQSGKPFATLGEFRSSLNATSGTLAFAQSAQVPNEVDGTATFNYGVHALGVLADQGHQFTSCTFPAGTCAISSSAHPNDYVTFTLTTPAAAGTQLPIALALSPNPTPGLPFQFFGFDPAGHRQGPLLTSGP